MDVLLSILSISGLSAIMILLVVIVRTLLKQKMSLKLVSMLWFLVLIRLLLPITLPSPVHLDSLLPKQEASVSDTTPIAPETPNEAVNTSELMVVTTNAPADDFVVLPTIDFTHEVSTKPVVSTPTVMERLLSFVKGINYGRAGLFLWMVGMVFLLIKYGYSYLAFRYKIRGCRGQGNYELRQLMERNKRILDLCRAVTISECPYVDMPVTFSFGTPMILLPVGFSKRLSMEKLNLIILHELCHIKRRDILKNYLWLLAKVVHWFNPLVHVAYAMYLDDVELGCDAMVLRHIHVNRVCTYSQSLLDVMKLSRYRKRLPMTVPFFKNKTKLRERVTNMLEPNQKTRIASVIAILLAVVMVLGGFTTACQPTTENLVDKSKVEDTHLDSINQAKDEPKVAPNVEEPQPSVEKASLNYAYESHVTEILTPKDETLHISFDAEVIVPETDALHTMNILPANITQEQVDTFLDHFYPDRKDLESKPIPQMPTKAEIEAEILNRKEWIATKECVMNKRSGKTSHEEWQDEIDFLESQLKDAPDENPAIPDYDITKFSIYPLMEVFREAGVTIEELNRRTEESKARIAENNTELINFTFHTEDDSKYYVYALRSDSVNVNMMYVYHSQRRPNGQFFDNDTDIPEMTVTFDEAKGIADEAVELLGLDYMDVAYTAKTWDSERIKETREEKTSPMYYFVYTRDVNGANVNYTENHIDVVRLTYRPWEYEFLEVWIDDEGLQGVNLNGCPSILGQTLTEDTPLLPFDDVMAKARQSFNQSILKHSSNAYHLYWADENSEHTVHNNNIIIDKIELGYMKVKNGEDPKDCIIIPVWDFIGRESVHMDVKHKNYDEYIEERTEMPEEGYGDQHSFLTINAIDGSIIDRSLGY